jgi:hypothetical protein
MRASHFRAWRLHGRGFLSERLHPLHQAHDLVHAEPGADLARITQYATIVDAED